MKRILLAILLFSSAHHLWAQITISPVVTECPKKCSGTFTISNGGLIPLAVTVQAKSFSVAGGKQLIRPLDADVKLSETSARISPHDKHDFDFNIKCTTVPCQVQVEVAAIMGHTTEGVAVRAIMPEVVYAAYPRQGLPQANAGGRWL